MITSFILKIIALVTMFCDHFGDAFIGHFSFFNLIGRIAFPIFAFQLSEGYTHTHNLKKYFFRLFLFAIISQLPFQLFLNKFLPTAGNTLNIFFTLTLGLLCMVLYDYFLNISNKELSFKIFGIEFKKIIGILAVLLIAYIGNLLNVDYGFWGIIVIFSFYLFKNNKLAMILSYVILCIIRYGLFIIDNGFYIQYIYLGLATIFPIIFISLYNGKQGYKIKYLLYVFYPVHLLLLYLFMWYLKIKSTTILKFVVLFIFDIIKNVFLFSFFLQSHYLYHP